MADWVLPRPNQRWAMSEASDEFEKLLEVFQSECRDAVRYVYSMHALYASIFGSQSATTAMGSAATFWNTALDALLTSAVVTLGRIFDPEGRNYSVNRLLKHCVDNIEIFELTAFTQRQMDRYGLQSREQAQQRIDLAFVPTYADFQQLKKSVEQRRKFYVADVKPFRHEIFAHRGVAQESEISNGSTSIDPEKLRECVLFLQALGQSLHQLYFDGVRPSPTVSNVPTSEMLLQKNTLESAATLPDRVVADVRRVISSIVAVG